VLPVIVLGGIYGGITTPTEAAALALVYGLIIELLVYKKLKFKDLVRVVCSSAVTSASLTLILCCAFGFTWLLTINRVPVHVAEVVTGLIASKWVFLLILNSLLIVMGCFLELISVILVIGPILLPTLEVYNISLVHFGIMMIVNAEVGFMTPPFGLNIFVAMGVTRQTFWEVARAVFPFMLIFLGLLLVITYVPQISTFLPDLFYAPGR
jgi:C4-dicarboxylate transporter DctM subunit